MKTVNLKSIEKELRDIEEKAMRIRERIEKISKMMPANKLISGVSDAHFTTMRSILNDIEKSAEILRMMLGDCY